MDDQVLGLLRWGLLGLLYVFFARVMWAVWTEVRTAPPTVRQRAHGIAVVEPPEVRGPLHWSEGMFVIGRGRDCDLSLPGDAFLSQRHVGVTRDRTGLWVEDLGSTNGTEVDGRAVAGCEPLFQGAKVSAGTVVLEAR